MNNNTTRWAVKVQSPSISEAIQRIAFSFEYQWQGDIGKPVVKNTHSTHLVFDPTTKKVFFIVEFTNVENHVCKIVETISEAIELFKTPPTCNLQLGSNISVDKYGKVTFYGYGTSRTISTAEFDNLVEKRNEFLGRKTIPVPTPQPTKLPVVTFRYRSGSDHAVPKDRKVLVLRIEDGKLVGLDVNDGNAFKKFILSRFVGDIKFVGFVDGPVKK